MVNSNISLIVQSSFKVLVFSKLIEIALKLFLIVHNDIDLFGGY